MTPDAKDLEVAIIHMHDRLTHRVDLYRSALDEAWAVASRIAKEKLLRERRFLPEFLR